METITEIRRQRRNPFFCWARLRTTRLAAKARARSAAFLKQPFFPADIEAQLCRFYGLRAVNSQRA